MERKERRDKRERKQTETPAAAPRAWPSRPIDPIIFRCEHLIAILESISALRPEDCARNARYIGLIRDLRNRMLAEILEGEPLNGSDSEVMLLDTLECLAKEMRERQAEIATRMKKHFVLS